MAATDKQAKERRRLYVERQAKAVRRKMQLWEYTWKRYKETMDVEKPGWDRDKLYVAKAKAVLRQEFEAKFHSDVVVVPNLS